MALSSTLLPSIATFAAGAAGREKAARLAGPGNVSIGVTAAPAGCKWGWGGGGGGGAGWVERGVPVGRGLNRVPLPAAVAGGAVTAEAAAAGAGDTARGSAAVGA